MYHYNILCFLFFSLFSIEKEQLCSKFWCSTRKSMHNDLHLRESYVHLNTPTFPEPVQGGILMKGIGLMVWHSVVKHFKQHGIYVIHTGYKCRISKHRIQHLSNFGTRGSCPKLDMGEGTRF